MSRVCERCGARGPWRDNPKMPGHEDVDYCECSENLCERCMNEPDGCLESTTMQHKPYVDPEDDDDE